jgi:phospholipid/cholesterol/gamma-HCH transport system substrate-binding protein
MQKQAPSLGRIAAMVVFAMSCFALLLFLWLSFGGPIPLEPKGYRYTVKIPEAATLAVEADVRLAGVNVGKVKKKTLDEDSSRTQVELEVDSKYAPVSKDTRVMLRQKTLLGETYVEMTPGNRSKGILDDGAELPAAQVRQTIELDEIFSAFDEPTRQAFRDWIKELNAVAAKGRGQDLNDVFGNLPVFTADGAQLLQVLDEQGQAVQGLVKNTGRVFGAINEREGALRRLIVNSNETFEATASVDESLSEVFRIFPTFLDESRATLTRLERFSRDTRPLVVSLKKPADDLAPTVRDLGDLAPDLERLFRDLPPLIRASRNLRDAEQIIQGADPVLGGLHTFLTELNPILSYLNFHQSTIAMFLTIGATNIAGNFGGERYQVNFGLIDERSFMRNTKRPAYERGNAYMAPNALLRAMPMGVIESFDCPAGEKKEPTDTAPPGQSTMPPCFVQPPSLYDNKQFPKPAKGQAPNVDAPQDREGTKPADPQR